MRLRTTDTFEASSTGYIRGEVPNEETRVSNLIGVTVQNRCFLDPSYCGTVQFTTIYAQLHYFKIFNNMAD